MKCPPMACPTSEGISLLATSAVTIPPGSQAILDSQILYELPGLYSPPSLGRNKPYLFPGILDVSHKDPVQLLVANLTSLPIHVSRGIDNFSPLELQAQERESNLEPGFPQAAGPEDRETNRPHFSGIEPLRADVEEDNLPRKVDQAKEIIALSGMPITTPNGGGQATTISFMSLKSSPATNQEPTQGRGTGPQPGPMTTTLE
ncbi:hypothetical protein DSO57_1022073 [Entomophthora muscae]|uniref:Uncharacterized protein n=1 Tax=Entomophthora muscae TaxID=34485 RepID=A0ACC2TQB8_9FUNG|nr:hypothetical protein DSO57_1022073 [Entomophthora muscae]